MNIAFLITAHVPYVRRAARAPVGEEQLHLTIAEGIIPLINMLWELHNARLNPRIGLACSPLLLEQLADPVVQKHFVLWMQSWADKALESATRSEREGIGHQAYLARFYLEWATPLLMSFEQRFSRALTKELQALCNVGVVEPLAGAASHAYLPLLSRPESLRAQVELGIWSVTQHLRRPKGLWLPGCGVRPELPPLLAATGLRYLVVDHTTLEYETLQPDGEKQPAAWLYDHRLAALPMDETAGLYVWSSDAGYWGDPLYRDPRRDMQSGLACWARGAGGAAPYDPYHAFRRAQDHANHYVSVLDSLAQSGVKSVLVPLDLHLIGSDWFEGMMWLRSVLMQCSNHPRITLVTPRVALRHSQPEGRATLRSASWGAGGDHRSWQGPHTTAYWQDVYDAEHTFAELVAAIPAPHAVQERLLNQALRELLLLQSSDWPEMLAAGFDETEAMSRWRTHMRRFNVLADLLEQPLGDVADLSVLDQLEEQDNPFPDLNYRVYRP